ncbi:lecithin retinol acyltransferase family protein [Pseudomonas sp. GM48]|uniref:lecithin retinol acyltransferase family protein n=1 Tax=Pseudomonas sp. GM48 TaxID=1144330 RepID=UPI00026FF66F|nr:lecithin retinol acyltransferase family protein [Pseudomonas sp. GM48]EJM62821.1 NC domain containing protein [Pseudomonas sp. GM48]
MNTLAVKLLSGFSSLWSGIVFCLALMAMEFAGYLKALVLESCLLAESCDSNESPRSSFMFPLRLVHVEKGGGDLSIGSHLISPRKFYVHHGIYLGYGEVAHYSGFSSSLKPGPIEVTDLESFANGKPVWVMQESCEFSNDEIVSRARSRMGESQYRILSNNCEHFCSWCVSGKSCSTQVRAFLHYPRYLLSFISALELYFIA